MDQGTFNCGWVVVVGGKPDCFFLFLFSLLLFSLLFFLSPLLSPLSLSLSLSPLSQAMYLDAGRSQLRADPRDQPQLGTSFLLVIPATGLFLTHQYLPVYSR